MKIFRASLFIVAFFASYDVSADDLQDKLFAEVVGAAQCQQTVNNGMTCDYKISDELQFSIKDAGGTDTVIGFHKSNIDARLYAVMYFGCVAVVPGLTHPRGYSKDYGVFVSPMNGRSYQTVAECKASRK